MADGLLKSLRKNDNLYKKTKKQPLNCSLINRYTNMVTLLTGLLEKTKDFTMKQRSYRIKTALKSNGSF